MKHAYAPHIRRLAAAMIDSFILGMITVVIRMSLVGGTNIFQLASLVSFIISAFYYIGFWVKRNGQTPGKQAMHLKIIKEYGKSINWFTGIIRYLSALVSSFVFCLGYLWILFDKRHQGWHDKLAKTLVVESDDQKPNGCLTAFGCIIPIIFFILCIGIGIVVAFKKVQPSRTVNSISTFLSSMKPETKVHYDKSEELFKQMRDASADRQKTAQLNDQNIAELQKAIVIEPNNAQLWYTLGQAYTWVSTSGTLDDGIKAFQKAEQLDPTNDIYIANTADMFWRAGKNDEAILEANKSIRLDADNYAFPHEVLARAYRDNKIFDQARTQYQKAIDIWTKNNKTGDFDSDILEVQKEMAALPK